MFLISVAKHTRVRRTHSFRIPFTRRRDAHSASRGASSTRHLQDYSHHRLSSFLWGTFFVKGKASRKRSSADSTSQVSLLYTAKNLKKKLEEKKWELRAAHRILFFFSPGANRSQNRWTWSCTAKRCTVWSVNSLLILCQRIYIYEQLPSARALAFAAFLSL